MKLARWMAVAMVMGVAGLVLVVGMAAATQAATMSTQDATVACSNTDLLQTEFESVAGGGPQG
ncbi:MAG: hypothetical protein WBD63_00020 [Phycisphaerae bacterium]